MIDLRSDTVTRPTAGMRSAMAAAEVGDDVWGDDPTVHALQRELARRAGHEAGLLFPSGTQSNLAAILSHCERGDEYIVGQDAHTYRYEGGGAAVLGSVQPQPIENAPDGSLPLEKIAAQIKPLDAHFARTRLLALENTIGGKVLPEPYVAAAAKLARQHGLALHLDGARVFNAAVASRRTLSDLCEPFDSVSICLSKGLGAPVGTVLVGRQAVIERAHRWRKVLGGGMRQSGMLAAAGLYALEHHVDRLAVDHANAVRLADGLQSVPGLRVLAQATNMVSVAVPAEDCDALEKWLQDGRIIAQISPETRLVTHLDVDSAQLERVVQRIAEYFERK